MPVSVAGRHLPMPMTRNRHPLFVMGQVVIHLCQQVFFAFIVHKVLPWHKIIQKPRLVIAKEEPPRPHNVKRTQRDAAFDTAHGYIQVDPALFKSQGHFTDIVNRAVVFQAGYGKILRMGKQIHGMFCGYGFQKVHALYRCNPWPYTNRPGWGEAFFPPCRTPGS